MQLTPPNQGWAFKPLKNQLAQIMPYVWPALSKKQVDHPESVSHGIQGKVSVRTEIFVGRKV